MSLAIAAMASEVPAEPGSPPQPGPSSTANDEDVGPILPPSLDKLPTVEEEEEVEVGPTLPQAKKRRVSSWNGGMSRMALQPV